MSLRSSSPSPAHVQPNSDDSYIPDLYSPMSSPMANENPNPMPSEAGRSSNRSGTPPGRKIQSGIDNKTREALKELYFRAYCETGPLCLITQSKNLLEVAHCVQSASKPCDLTLYEYCLGLDHRGFHVHSRRNLFYLDATRHLQFDHSNWLLLPTASSLQEVHTFIQTVLSARRESPEAEVVSFKTKWNLEDTWVYTLIPLIRIDPIPRDLCPEGDEPWVTFQYPFNNFPDLACHVPPPLVAINGGPKLIDQNLDEVVAPYCGSSGSRDSIKSRLETLEKIWNMIEEAREDSVWWGKAISGKRKRDQDDEDIERLSRSTRRTTRSQGRGKEDAAGDEATHRPSPNVSAGKAPQKRKQNSGKLNLTERAVYRHTMNNYFSIGIKRWIESIPRSGH